MSISKAVFRCSAAVWATAILLGEQGGAPAWAQQAPGPEASQQSEANLGDIVVTAQRREERLQETPVSVTAFSDAALARQSISNLSGIARFTPNVEISSGLSDGGGSAFQAYIRGIGQRDFLFPNEPGVGLYIDDVYFSSVGVGTMALADVERIEVLRGPQGTLYGKNTIGGAIKVITRRANLEEWSGLLEGTTGSFNRADFRGYVTGPIIKDVLAFKLSVAAVHRDGYGHRLLQDFDLGNENKQVVRGELRWKPDPALEVTLRGDYTRQRQHGMVSTLINRTPSDVDLTGLVQGVLKPAGLNLVDPTPENGFLLDDLFNALLVPYWQPKLGLPANARYDSRYVTGNPYTDYGTDRSRDDNDSWGGSLAIDWNVTDQITARSITAYRKLTGYFPQDCDHTPFPVCNTQNRERMSQISEEVQLGGKAFDGRLNWLTGAFYMRQKGLDDNQVDLISGLYEALNPVVPFLFTPSPCTGSGPTASCVTPGAFSFDYRPMNKITTTSWAIFGQGTFAVTDRLSFTLGGRFSKDRKVYIQDHRYTRIPDPRFGPGLPGYTGVTPPLVIDGLARLTGPRTLRDSWSAFTPKVGVEFKPDHDHMLYANWSKGFKGGGWNPRPTQENGTESSFGQELISTFEVGSKNTLLNGLMIFNLAAFYSNYKDVQLYTLGSSPGGALLVNQRNVGDARIWGLEAETTLRPVEGLELTASGGYLNAKWKRFNRDKCSPDIFDMTKGQFCDADLSLDDRLVDTPKWTANFGAQYRVDLHGSGSLTPRVDASYRSKVWKESYNLGRGPNAFGVLNPISTLPFGIGPYYAVTKRELAQDPYWLVNARLSWMDSSEKLEIAAAVTNVFDKQYFTGIHPVVTFGHTQGYSGRPREWSLTATYRF